MTFNGVLYNKVVWPANSPESEATEGEAGLVQVTREENGFAVWHPAEPTPVYWSAVSSPAIEHAVKLAAELRGGLELQVGALSVLRWWAQLQPYLAKYTSGEIPADLHGHLDGAGDGVMAELQQAVDQLGDPVNA